MKEAYRGRGIGTALMEAALQAARDTGQKKAVLTSNHQLREALRLYERFGFKYVTYSDKWFQLSDIRMERELAYREKYPGSAPTGGAGVFFTTRSLRTGELGDVVDPLPGAEAVQANAELDELLGHDAHIDPEDAPLEH